MMVQVVVRKDKVSKLQTEGVLDIKLFYSNGEDNAKINSGMFVIGEDEEWYFAENFPYLLPYLKQTTHKSLKIIGLRVCFEVWSEVLFQPSPLVLFEVGFDSFATVNDSFLSRYFGVRKIMKSTHPV